MKLTVYEEKPEEEEVKLKLVSFGKGVRVVVVDEKGNWRSGNIILEIYPSGLRRIKGFTHIGFQKDSYDRIIDITGCNGPF